MNKLTFTSKEYLVNFLFSISEFKEWETAIFRLSASNGINLGMNTRIVDPLGIREYTEFKNLLSMFEKFYTDYSYLNLNIEIKLKMPFTVREGLDPNDDYEAFYLSFYVDSTQCYASLSFVERNVALPSEPVKNASIYVTNFYNRWLESIK